MAHPLRLKFGNGRASQSEGSLNVGPTKSKGLLSHSAHGMNQSIIATIARIAAAGALSPDATG